MPSVVYVVRSALHTVSPALLPGDDCTVVSVGDPLFPGKVLHATDDSPLGEGERLSYEQLLEVVLQSQKVMTL
jgi:hypothetical protein